MKIMRFILFFIAIMVAVPVQARPVSYPGGWTGMIMNDGDKNSAHIHYSPTVKMSLGYKGEYWREGEYTINALQMNNLLKRWNQKESQGNLYLKSGLGIASDMRGNFADDHEAAGFTGIAVDWENRRFFTSYENRYTEAGDIANGFRQSTRIGVAPYIGNYGDLHTWMMLQVDHNPEGKEKVTVTPLLRFFKGVNLMEAGISNQGDVLFNWVIRY